MEKIQPTVTPTPVKAGQPPKARRRAAFQTILIPFLAVITGLIIGAIVIILTDARFTAAIANAPGSALREAWNAIRTAYGALFTGAFGSPSQIVAALGHVL